MSNFISIKTCYGYSKEPSQRDGSFEHPKTYDLHSIFFSVYYRVVENKINLRLAELQDGTVLAFKKVFFFAHVPNSHELAHIVFRWPKYTDSVLTKLLLGGQVKLGHLSLQMHNLHTKILSWNQNISLPYQESFPTSDFAY